MVKEPRAGRVKTRLAKDIGVIPATWWFRHQSAALIRRLSADRRWQTILAISPDVAGMQSRVWPAQIKRHPQGRGDLGARMRRIFQETAKGPVVIIGADIPAITARHIERAFHALGDHSAVLGPAKDGGYWCIGLRRGAGIVPDMFAGVRWSTCHALQDTLANLAGLPVALVEVLQDVDTAADL